MTDIAYSLEFIDFEVLKTLYSGKKNIILKAIRLSDHQEVILKKIKSDYPSTHDIASFYHEYQILSKLSYPGIIKILDVVQEKKTLALVLEDKKSQSLKKIIRSQGLDLTDFFNIAIQITKTIVYLHQQKIIHKDIKPDNITVSFPNSIIQLIDFSISSEVAQEIQETQTISNLEGTLEYLSPEQTGRINGVIDFRSDLYSLGITFYEMLAGAPPFQSHDPLEIVYSHLAKTPPDLSTVNPLVPRTISAIIHKLLLKAPEERYQTASGLLYDLEYSEQQWKEKQKIFPFKLGQKDYVQDLRISSKLYGRDEPLQLLKHIFEKLDEQVMQTIFIKGYSGIGKSSLIKEIQPYILKQRCLFIEGKFDQMQHQTPYFVFIQALKKFAKELLTEPEQHIAKVKQSILDVVGGQGQVILDLVPEMEYILGKQPPITPLPTTEAQNRFNIIIGKFFQSLATPAHPLVIFLDDLQWVDLASLALIESTILSLQSVLLIGAYRSNEVESHHPLNITIQNIKNTSSCLHEINLEPLDKNTIAELLKDTFEKTDVSELSTLIMQKTGGNPFFVKELLYFFYEKGFIYFENHEWKWNISEMQAQNVTENIIDLMTQKIYTLPKDTRLTLSIAAFLGNTFDLQVLAQVLKKSEQTILKELEEALQVGLISLSSENQKRLALIKQEVKLDERIVYQFTHDRIQQASYNLVKVEDRPAFHFNIANLGLQLDQEDLVNHFNRALDLIKNPSQKEQLITWNIELARKAKDATAYQAALSYLEAAEYLSQAFSWETHSALLFELYKEKAECHYLLLQFNRAEQLFTLLLNNVKQRELKASIYRLKITLYTHLDKSEEALEAGQQGLALYSVYFPKRISDLHILREVIKIKVITYFKNLDQLQPMTNEEARMTAELMNALLPASYQIDRKLFAYICLKSIQITFKYGYTPFLISFLAFIMTLLAIHDYKGASFYLRIVYQINDKLNQAVDWGPVLILIETFLKPWVPPFLQNLDLLKKGTLLSLESGFFFYAGLGYVQIFNYLFYTGEPLDKVEEQASRAIEFLQRHRKPAYLEHMVIYKENVHCLRTGEAFKETLVLENLQAIADTKNLTIEQAAVASLNFIYYMLEKFDLALQMAQRAFPLRHLSTNAILSDEHNLFFYLTFSKQGKYIEDMKLIEKSFKGWVKQNPYTFSGMYALILAEKACVLGEFQKAIDFYDKALSDFQSKKWIHYSAVTNERVAELYFTLGRTSLAKFYMKEAYYYYSLWGAKAKIILLEKRYEDLFYQDDKSFTLQTTSPSTTSIDFLSIVKSSQAISEEIMLDQLIKKTMRIILENTDAQRGLLIVKKDNESLWIEASTTRDSDDQPTTEILKIPCTLYEDFPSTLIAHTNKTQQQILINPTQSIFQQDPYFTKVLVKAALCLPIKYQGGEIGIFYLEHYSDPHAFNIQHLKSLNLLMSQIAISLENAYLYAASKRFVPFEFLDHLSKSNIIQIALGDRIEQDMTILFADIRGFTSLSESLSPTEVFDLINQFLGHCAPIVRKHEGFVDKYIGDAIMALFFDTDKALLAALEITEAIEELNKKRQAEGLALLFVDIGINTGSVMLGIIGEEQRLSSSVLGDSVNTASRIEELNKKYNTTILMSGESKMKIKNPDAFHLQFLEEIQLRGRQEAIEVWQLIGLKKLEVNTVKSR